MRAPASWLAALLLVTAAGAGAAVTVVDDAGRQVTLQQPAKRIISMAPHATELLFAAGGGARVVGAMNYSDYPEAAKAIPLVGSNSQIDMERVLALKPDLIVVWHTGNTARQIAQVESLGVPVFHSEPRRLGQVADNIERLGQLLGTGEVAGPAAGALRTKLAGLEARYGKRSPVTVFYQIWDQPLYTLNDAQIASDAIRVCGGRNVFGGLKVVAPQVSTEAVLAADPEAVLAGKRYDPANPGLKVWAPYKSMTAVKRGNLVTVDGELLTRPGPRTVEGAGLLCEALEAVRQRRPK
ncbi:cobalamin-binding protein [Massilia yuzhufengensis]|uniref:Iron complex transport system substrate-binding protein n=1 Tax=Massilia yuzhufengensis TaxID=1164594 RepID=A0A1I1STY8_9BURK|nr:cobalamin-binding protein [Massilia yuzhufengensis]SFD49917.1 iron complex transport system substrate-binding protein [Massilia yuzhufengensis]